MEIDPYIGLDYVQTALRYYIHITPILCPIVLVYISLCRMK